MLSDKSGLPGAPACVRVAKPRLRNLMPKPKKTGKESARKPRESVRVLITGARIQRRIQELAKQIRNDFRGEQLHLVSVLKGGGFFLTDLARSIPGEAPFAVLTHSGD